MHKEQKDFCEMVRFVFPEYFTNVKVLDCGSQDINGNNRYLFHECLYDGLDIGPGPNVDIVMPIHEYYPRYPYKTIISTECFEHDRYFEKSIQRIQQMLAPGGLFLFTCATTGRQEHGTHNIRPGSSPHTNDYYKNVTIEMARSAMSMSLWDRYEFTVNNASKDLYFWGIKTEKI